MPLINDLPLFGLFRKIYIAAELYNRELTSPGDREGIPEEVTSQSEPEDAELLVYSVKHQGKNVTKSQMTCPRSSGHKGDLTPGPASHSPLPSVFFSHYSNVSSKEFPYL